MKKATFVIFFIGFLIPQIALASWWNPFSWKIFYRTDTNTQILENRVKELEKKLVNKATTTALVTKETSAAEVKAQKIEVKISAKQKTKIIQDIKTETPKKVVETFTTPSGAIIDDAGNIISPPTNTNQFFSTLSQQIAELNKKLEEQKQIQQQTRDTLQQTQQNIQQIQQNTTPTPEPLQPPVIKDIKITYAGHMGQCKEMKGKCYNFYVYYYENGERKNTDITISTADDGKFYCGSMIGSNPITCPTVDGSGYQNGGPIADLIYETSTSTATINGKIFTATANGVSVEHQQ